ncbi:MAG: DUF2914 domain-containing protein [Gammaproteobacteria bacterium]
MSEEAKEKKKVVFKVNFSKEDAQPKNSDPKYVTEWNYIRIAGAVLAMLILILIGIKISGDDEQVPAGGDADSVSREDKVPPVSSTSKTGAAAVGRDGNPAANAVDGAAIETKSIPAAGGVIRAQLAKGIWENEPFGDVTLPVIVSSREATGVFYFTELENMQGRDVYHVWKRDGEVIFRMKKNVTDRRWKTYTSKLFTPRLTGSWTVETTDGGERRLNVIHFDVVAAGE